jgi:hypothetical protein
MAVPNQDDETPITSRMPGSLVKEIQDIADETSRSRSKTIVLLLRKGIESYREDGILGERRVLPNSAEERTRKSNSHLAIASPKTIAEQYKELCSLSGEDVSIDALVMYHEYHDKGDERFLTDYTDHVQQLVTAYKEGRIQEFLSETQAPEEKTAG